MIRQALAAAVPAVFVATAGAQVFSEFNYSSLTGVYDDTAQQLTLSADENSAGRVVLQQGVETDTAVFENGFVGLGGASNFVMTFSIANIGATTADGAGTFLITDVDGDVFNGTFAGVWTLGAAGIFFNGAIDFAEYSGAAGDGVFEGSAGGAFDLPGSSFTGGAQSFAISFDLTDNFFEDDFVAQFTAQGQVPTPATIALASIGGLVAAGRRRR